MIIFHLDETDSSSLWVKRDMPSPKRSPKSPKKPPPIPSSPDTQNIKTDTKPMSPITRASTLPKPWSPSANPTLSLQRKFSLEERKVDRDGLKVERKQSIEEKKENEYV